MIYNVARISIALLLITLLAAPSPALAQTSNEEQKKEEQKKQEQNKDQKKPKNSDIENIGNRDINKGLSQMAASGGMGTGVAEPPIAITVKQGANEITLTLKYESGGGSQPLTASFTLDGKVTQVPDPADPRPAYNYKRIATWDGARLVLRTIHGLNNIREVWVLDGTVLRAQRAAQTPGGADSATRNLVYSKTP